MRNMAVGLAALVALAFAGPAFGMDETEQIQESEQPGSEIEIGAGSGGATIERRDGQPLIELGGENDMGIQMDPADPAEDPIDNELPGEGPEDLSGPFDED